MLKFTATDLKNRLGEVADEARSRPVVITRNGRPDLVLLSARTFARLRTESDLVWGAAAERAHARRDYLSVEESATMLRRMMGEADGLGIRGGVTGRDQKRPARPRRRQVAVAAE